MYKLIQRRGYVASIQYVQLILVMYRIDLKDRIRVNGIVIKQFKNTPNIEQDDDDIQDTVSKNTQELGMQIY
ncbi:hypothetical protein pb186bvf_020863 [Paramecium bursaria]